MIRRLIRKRVKLECMLNPGCVASLITNNDKWRESYCSADARLAPSQWETSLQSNAVSHWLGANLDSALLYKWGICWKDKTDKHHIRLRTYNISYNVPYGCVSNGDTAVLYQAIEMASYFSNLSNHLSRPGCKKRAKSAMVKKIYMDTSSQDIRKKTGTHAADPWVFCYWWMQKNNVTKS